MLLRIAAFGVIFVPKKGEAGKCGVMQAISFCEIA